MDKQHMDVQGRTLIVGVSGGGDSVCLLHVLHRLQSEFHLKLVCVHINHMLRETAERDEDFTREFAAKLDIPFYVKKADVKKLATEEKLSEEEAGRMVRRAFYEEVCEKEKGDYIVLAHHKNDNAETMLFHLIRGTNLKGMGGIRPVQGKYLRPLLCVERKEIEAYLEKEQLSFMEDETNREDAYARNAIRHHMIPKAEEICSAAVEHMAEAGESFRETEEYLAMQTEEAFKACVKEETDGLHLNGECYGRLHSAIGSRLIYLCLERIGGRKDLTRTHVELCRALLDHQTGKNLHLPGGITLVKTYDGMVFLYPEKEAEEGTEIPACHGNSIPLDGLGVAVGTLLDEWQFANIPKKTYTKWFDYDKIIQCPVFRKRRDGDYLVIDEKGSKKSLNRYMIDAKIPSYQREKLWILACGSRVIWIPGYRISEDCKVGPESKRVIQWEVNSLEAMNNLGGNRDE
ncbi:MAG: tRNA lysidine(34) synthetase TilS [Lachnospiraceae bacterium]|nr:tRNA lysidine(34) synthetase TilS [Lachnospiraceae bacterium]